MATLAVNSVAFWRISGPHYCPVVDHVRQVREGLDRLRNDPEAVARYNGQGADGAPPLPDNKLLALLVAINWRLWKTRTDLVDMHTDLKEAGFGVEDLPEEADIMKWVDDQRRKQAAREQLGYWMYTCIRDGHLWVDTITDAAEG